ncbi:NYN domain-containing protein [Kineococcus gypseus]|uniref:NYN domain-containing protein n=1 Tax=Kineococcus gypseus TaxID=1637102 RepID=UPI003D7C9D1C
MDSPRPHEPARDLDLLVWDAPNIDMTLSAILGSRPASSDRPRFDAIARWFLAEAGDHEVEGCVFTNVQPAAAVSLRGWIEALRSFGYAVFARPKLQPEDDVDDAMLHHIAERAATYRLRRLVVASGDGRNFLAPLEELRRAGVRCVVLSFAEVAGYAQESPHIEFVDLEDVPGAFQVSLGRTRLTALPPEGGWFRPTRPMRALLDEQHPAPAPVGPALATAPAPAPGPAPSGPEAAVQAGAVQAGAVQAGAVPLAPAVPPAPASLDVTGPRAAHAAGGDGRVPHPGPPRTRAL